MKPTVTTSSNEIAESFPNITLLLLPRADDLGGKESFLRSGRTLPPRHQKVAVGTAVDGGKELGSRDTESIASHAILASATKICASAASLSSSSPSAAVAAAMEEEGEEGAKHILGRRPEAKMVSADCSRVRWNCVGALVLSWERETTRNFASAEAHVVVAFRSFSQTPGKSEVKRITPPSANLPCALCAPPGVSRITHH